MAAGPGPGPGGGSGITPKELFQIVRRRKLLIAITWTIVAGIGVVGTYLWLKYLPFYTATAYLNVRPPEMTLYERRPNPYPKDVIERYKRTQATLIKQQVVLQQAARDQLITKTKWYQQRHQKNMVRELAKAVGVAPVPETSLVKLYMTGSNREELADIVNAVANSFVLHSGRGTRDEIARDIDKLDIQRKDIQQALRRVRTDIANARAKSAAAGMDKRRSRVGIMIGILVPQAAEAEIAQAQADAFWQTHQEDVRSGAIARSPEVLRTLEMDPQLRGSKIQATDIETRLSNVLERMGPQHRTVRRLKGLLESINAQIEDRHKTVVTNTVDSIGQIRQTDVMVSTKQLAELKMKLIRVQKESEDLEQALGRIDALQKEGTANEDNLRRVTASMLELQTLLRGKPGQERREVGPVSLAQSATLPLEPSWPQWKVFMPLGLFLGFVLSFGLAFLLEFADTSIKSPADVVRKVDMPLLGMVPHSDDLDEEIEDFRRVTLLAPHSPATEAFRQLRTNLLFSGPAEGRRSLLITSPAPEDGRTTVVTNLAVSMAQSGRRVLVVDANFRQPAIAGMYPDAAAAGLSSALVGQTSWRDAVSPMDVPNCEVITAGPLPPNPAELLGSEMMSKILAEMTAEYDQVIFDGSPVMVVSDACVLATQVDGVVLVVRAGSNSAGIVQRAAERLTRIGAHVLGVVLQGVRTTAGGYLRKNYQTFYEYQQKSLP